MNLDAAHSHGTWQRSSESKPTRWVGFKDAKAKGWLYIMCLASHATCGCEFYVLYMRIEIYLYIYIYKYNMYPQNYEYIKKY